MSSEDWRAWIDAMPGPQPPRLVVTGRVTLPWGGWRPVLELGPTLESDPPIQELNFSARGQGGARTMAVTTQEVTATFRALPRYRSILIRCNGDVLAEISPVGTAH